MYVHPGRLEASAELVSFVTVVGTGVAVCLWDPSRRVGGMAHFLLPEAGTAPAAPRYGDVALKSLLEKLAAFGGRSYRAFLYGGSAPPIVSESGHLGDRNVEAALALLRLRAVPVVARDLGGTGGRKVVFDLSLGEMLWSRRTIFMLLVVGAPVVIALFLRVLVALGAPVFENSEVSTSSTDFDGVTVIE